MKCLLQEIFLRWCLKGRKRDSQLNTLHRPCGTVSWMQKAPGAVRHPWPIGQHSEASQGCEKPQPFPKGWTEVGGLSEAFIYWVRQCSGMAPMAAVLLDPAAQVPVWAG